MVTSMENEEKAGGSISYGIMGGIDRIDANFSVDFLLYYSDKGINKVINIFGITDWKAFFEILVKANLV